MAIVIGLTAGLVLVTIPAATAHSGNGGGLSYRYLEAETYDKPDDRCDPDFHDEHTFPRDGAVFLPHSGCGINWDSVTTSGTTCIPTSARVSMTGNFGDGADYKIRVKHLGDVIASGSAHLEHGQWTTVDLEGSLLFYLGTFNDVRVEYEASAIQANLWIDQVDYGFGCYLDVS